MRETTTELYSGQGIVYLAEKDSVTGVLLGYRDIGNVSDLKFSFNTDVIEHTESRTGNRLIDARLATKKTCTASLTMDSFDAEALKTTMFATIASVVAGTALAETITARLGKVVPTSKIKIANLVVKGTGAKSAVTYVIDKNYTINTESGSLYILSAAEQTTAGAVASIADADVLGLTFDHAAQTSVDAFQDSQKTYSLRFEGLNSAADNSPVIVTVPNFRPDPLKDLSLISNDFQTFAMDGSALADSATGKFVTIQKL